MKIKTIIYEDFTNYKLPCMFVGTCYCDWKCAKDGGFDCSICQNHPLSQQPNIEISNENIIQRYLNNNISKAICFGGLEPCLQFNEILDFVDCIRSKYYCNDDIVIYTGYYESEIKDKLELLKQYSNIIIKFGRYIPNQEPHYDSVLGVNLASNNQHAIKIS